MLSFLSPLAELKDGLRAYTYKMSRVVKGSSIMGTSWKDDDAWLITIAQWKGDMSKVPAAFVEQMWQEAKVAGYDNNLTGQTEFDTKVRNAKEITDFTIFPVLVEQVKARWQENPKEVRVEPHKINVYGPRCVFQRHVDSRREFCGYVFGGVI